MAKLRIYAALILVIILTALTGCNTASLKYGKTYTEYMYIGSESIFSESGRSLTINSDDTFTMVLSEGLILTGTTEHLIKEKTIYLDCDENTSEVVKQRFKETILNDPESGMSVEMLDMFLEAMTISEEVHYYKNYIYSSAFISAHRYIDTTLYSYGEDYNAFEGVYSVKNYDGLMLLQHGEIFVQDAEKPETGKFPIKRGSYVIGNDFITMTINDAEGNPQAPQKYLIAELTLPYEMRQGGSLSPDDTTTEKDEWYEAIEDQLESLAGKKIKVLVLCFYSSKKM